MIKQHRITGSAGFTLVELVVSMASAAVLLAGITSTMLVAVRASDPAETPAKASLQSLGCMADMSTELQCALAVTEHGETAITVVVPDREDANTTPETIRYAWSGVAGRPVTREYNNNGAPVSLIPSVHSFAIEYFPTAAAPEWITIRVQPVVSPRSTVETSIALLNL